MKKLSVVLWLPILTIFLVLSGIYKLDDGEEALITRFGMYQLTETGGGLKWKIPFIDKKYVINTSEVRRMEFGFKTKNKKNLDKVDSFVDISEDSLMITGDENLVNVMASIQYKIINSKDYKFNASDPEETLKIVGVSAIRRSVANNKLDDVLSDNKNAIMAEIREDLQKTQDKYGLGIQITQVLLQDVDPPKEVDDAFKDIVRAQLDKESKINEAISLENKILPKAKGLASKTVSDSEAYRETRISRAHGEVASFNQLYKEYKRNKNVTRTRLYLEAMKDVLGKIELVISDDNSNTLKILDLNQSTSKIENSLRKQNTYNKKNKTEVKKETAQPKDKGDKKNE